MSVSLKGGCLCGALRYQLSGQIQTAGFCHCRLCQRSSGAPVMAWLTIDASHFHYIKGEPASYDSSSRSQREFCPYCGTQLTFRTDNKTMLDVTVNSLDNPESVKPRYHIWEDSKPDWLQIGDMLPRYRDGGPA